MTQEDRNLLIRDLSARLPYGVKIELMPVTGGKCTTLTPIILRDYYISDDTNYLPYLRPLYSMTREEKKELERLIDEKLNGIEQEDDDEEWAPWVLHYTTGIRNSIGGEKFYFDDMSLIYDWLKSLKQRIGWKPSDEQMEALGMATDICSIPEKYYTELSKLYQDLKKLKG